MRAVDAFVGRIEYLITAGLQLHNQIVVLGIDKLASKPPHSLGIAITPASIATVRITPVAKIDRRSGGAKV
jgi:hypothetical protein